MNLDFTDVIKAWNLLLHGTLVTIEVTLCALVLSIILGLIVGVARINKKNRIIYAIFSTYVAIIRGTPLLVQLFIWYYGIPRIGLMLPSFFCGVVGMGLYSSAYVSEIVRGSILSIEPGQNEAARSLGMSSRMAMMKIILPQAIIRMLPPFGNEVIALLKNSALVSLITIHDVMQVGSSIIANTYRDLETYLVIAVIYFVLTNGATGLLRLLESWYRRKGVL